MIIVYERHTFSGLNIKFRFKLDQVGNDYLHHIFVRHLIDPETAITAYFNQTKKSYNISRQRWESYSKQEDLHLYYLELPGNEIFIISAFRIQN
jgi:hypothetical protein